MALGHQQLMMSFGGAAFGTRIHAIDSGREAGGPISGWSQDADFAGGLTYNWNNAIDTTGLIDPAPAAVYETVRYTPHSYLLTGFAASQPVKLRFHFTDDQTSTGVRVFDIRVQGSIPAALDNIDVADLVGNVKYKGLILEHVTAADGSGEVLIEVENVTGNGMIGGIESYV